MKQAKKEHQAAPAQAQAARDIDAGVSGLAQAIASTQGDPQALAKLMIAMPAQKASIAAAAQKAFGNAITTAAINIVESGLTEGAPDRGQKGPSAASGLGNPFEGGSTFTGKNKKSTEVRPGQREHGGSFAGQRVFGDGSGSMILGKGGEIANGEGHASDGDGPAPVAYPGSSGSGGDSGGSVPTSQGDSAGTTAGIASGSVMGPSKIVSLPAGSGTAAAATTKSMSASALIKAGKPVEGQDAPTSGAPIAIGHQRPEHGLAHVEKADGKDKTPQQNDAGGGRVVTRAEQAGAERERSTGTLNWDKVLEIDQLVNPKRS